MTAAAPADNEALPAAVIVAGPTGSGKSALAAALAQALRGTVVNADSMQVYRELRVLTARPTVAEEAAVPHRLYGIRPAAEPASVAWWRAEAVAGLRAIAAEGRVPILCGGTGLYLESLAGGLSAIPDPGPAARDRARALLAERGAPALHAALAALDPDTAAMLRPTDAQRVARAYEVVTGTGRGLAAWRRAAPRAGAAVRTFRIRLDPPRAALRAAIAARTERMVELGALAEVELLHGQHLPPDLPAMRAHGVREFGAYLAGRATLGEAIARTATVTAQYAKRQTTWLRHRWPGVEADRILADPAGAEPERLAAEARCMLERGRA